MTAEIKYGSFVSMKECQASWAKYKRYYTTFWRFRH
jgi:hypothetical protein